MVDLLEGTFKAVCRNEVPVGLCALTLDGNPLYVGSIANAPTPPTGSTLYLNPVDFERMNAFFKKQLH